MSCLNRTVCFFCIFWIIEQRSTLIIIIIIIIVIIIIIIIFITITIGGSVGGISTMILLLVVMKMIEWVRYYTTQIIFVPRSLSFLIMVMSFTPAKFAGVVIGCLKNHRL